MPASSAGEIVHRDATVKVSVTPQVFTANGHCTDPIECSSRFN